MLWVSECTVLTLTIISAGIQSGRGNSHFLTISVATSVSQSQRHQTEALVAQLMYRYKIVSGFKHNNIFSFIFYLDACFGQLTIIRPVLQSLE